MKTNQCIQILLVLVWLGLSSSIQPDTTRADEKGAQTGWCDFTITDFNSVHSPLNDDDTTALIFGNIPIFPPKNQLSPRLSAFLGRWEGYDSGPPFKLVLVIQTISKDGGTAFLWAGTDLQYPTDVKEIHFEVIQDKVPWITWNATWQIGPDKKIIKGGLDFSYHHESGELRGGIWFSPDRVDKRAITLTRGKNFIVHRNDATFTQRAPKSEELQDNEHRIESPMNLNEVLAFYRQYSEYTDPGSYESFFVDLPESLEALCAIVKAQLIHPIADLERYRDRIPSERYYEETRFPTAAAMLARLIQYNPAGLVPDRLPEERLVVSCRYHAILLASILKHRGIPTRLRYGFAQYLAPGQHISHVICEVWNTTEHRWMLVDPDKQMVDIPRERFDFAADIWQRYQQGGIDVSRYGVGSSWGIYPILDMLWHDFVSVQGQERLYWEHPPLTRNSQMDVRAIPTERLKIVNKIAVLLNEPENHLQELRALYKKHQFLQFR